jgi:hypothetical protein
MREADSFKANTLYIRTEENLYSLELDSGLLSFALQQEECNVKRYMYTQIRRDPSIPYVNCKLDHRSPFYSTHCSRVLFVAHAL